MQEHKPKGKAKAKAKGKAASEPLEPAAAPATLSVLGTGDAARDAELTALVQDEVDLLGADPPAVVIPESRVKNTKRLTTWLKVRAFLLKRVADAHGVSPQSQEPAPLKEQDVPEEVPPPAEEATAPAEPQEPPATTNNLRWLMEAESEGAKSKDKLPRTISAHLTKNGDVPVQHMDTCHVSLCAARGQLLGLLVAADPPSAQSPGELITLAAELDDLVKHAQADAFWSDDSSASLRKVARDMAKCVAPMVLACIEQQHGYRLAKAGGSLLFELSD